MRLQQAYRVPTVRAVDMPAAKVREGLHAVTSEASARQQCAFQQIVAAQAPMRCVGIPTDDLDRSLADICEAGGLSSHQCDLWETMDKVFSRRSRRVGFMMGAHHCTASLAGMLVSIAAVGNLRASLEEFHHEGIRSAAHPANRRPPRRADCSMKRSVLRSDVFVDRDNVVCCGCFLPFLCAYTAFQVCVWR